jgi:hypothetical protein
LKNKPDLVSADPETSRLLIVEVKDRIREGDKAFFINQMRNYAQHMGPQRTIYYILVDNDHIRFFSEKNNKPLETGTELNTKQTFKSYLLQQDRSFSEGYLAGVTQAWLRDLVLKWKSKDPAASDKIEPDIIDLLSRADVSFP